MTEQNMQRVELRLHTTTSDSVSLITPKELMQEAELRKLKAVAITDKDSVQNFREIARYRERYAKDLQVIYGAELILDPGVHATVLVKDQEGLKVLYKLLSGKTVTAQEREHLLIGIHGMDFLCEAARVKAPETLADKIDIYDYIELAPDTGDVSFREMNKEIYALGKETGKPLVAVGDCHYLLPQHRLGKNVIDRVRQGSVGASDQQLRTTEEMLELYGYLGAEAAYEVVVSTPNQIADSIGQVDPRKGNFRDFALQNAEQEVERICRERLQMRYGAQPQVQQRLEEELLQVKETAFSMYLLCHKLVEHLQKQGNLTGFRGTVGSTFVAYLLGISDVNPLPAHHYCSQCGHMEFAEAVSGFDLSKKPCPRCGKPMTGDGHNIPFETCLGVDRDMELDIDVNTTAAMQKEAKRFLVSLFGEERLAAAGTIGGYQRFKAKAIMRAYEELTGQTLSREEKEWIPEAVAPVKRCEGIHPGGIMVLPEGMEWEDVTPLRPNEDPLCPVATHMECHQIHPCVPKVDILAVQYYEQLEKLFAMTGTKAEMVDYQDPAVYALFSRGDTDGIPEFSTDFTKDLLHKGNATTFSDLVKINGMAHGTEVWCNNGETILGERPFRDLIGDRDDIFLTLRRYGMDRKTAYALMTAARKGKLPWEGKNVVTWPGIRQQMESLENSAVPRWYRESMRKIYYLFPKAHAAHYTKLAVTFAWFKVHYPEAFAAVTS